MSCYTSESSLTIDKNLQTMTLGLVSSGKAACGDIGPAVFINLTLHANGVVCDNVSVLANGFDYGDTAGVEFDFGDPGNIVTKSTIFCN